MFRVARGGAESLFQGCWMGLLPESVCDEISELSYGDGAAYSNGAYLDSGFHFWEELAIGRYFAPAGSVLVAAAGSGREMIALARAGFEADGFDCSRPMVQAGREALAARNIAGVLEWAPPCQIPPIRHPYDALIVGWNGYCYISPRFRRIAFLKNLKANLGPGAPVLVSGAFRTKRSQSAVWTPRVGNFVRRVTFRPPAFEAGDLFPGRPRHHFTRGQLEREMTDAGFLPAEFFVWGEFCALVCHNA